MNYFKFHIGDYAKKCGRLSMLEHGAYTQLIQACYDRERFPTLDALRALETINDGKGFASPAGVPPHAPAPPSPFKCAGKCEVKKNEQ